MYHLKFFQKLGLTLGLVLTIILGGTMTAQAQTCPVSNEVTINVNPDPSITAQPTNITECVGGTQQLSVTATGGTPSLTYQWQSSTAAAGTYTNISGATASTYTPPSTAAGTRYYRVLVAATGSGCDPVTSAVSTVVVNPNVSITAQPTNITECIGGTQQLSVTATGGVGAITYQWESAAAAAGPYAAVSGATASTYTPASTAAGTTYFRVVVTSAGGGCTSVTSNAGTVVIVADPSITAQPANITECVGGTQQLSVTATGGTPSLTYQWESAAAAAGPYTAVSGATASTYTPSAAAAGTMYYRVVVSASGNGCTSVTSNAATVVVNPNVSITAQPNSITECIGGTQQLSVTATGGVGAITYQWESAAAAAGPYAAVSGATASTYTPASTAAGTTYFRVVVTSAGGGCTSVTSNAGTVVIVADPSITAQPANITECVGGTQQLSVTATGGTPSLTYQWESAAAAAGPYTAVSGATASTYTPSAAAAGTMYYRVVVSASGNGCTSVTSNAATVVVNPNVSITAQPNSITECIGGTQQLSVTATGGVGAITYQWESAAAAAGPYAAVSGATASTYTPASTAAGTTYFRVVVTSAGGGCTSVTSSAGTVVIVADPSITAQPTNITECIGGTQQLSVTATGGTPSLTYQWESAAAAAGPFTAVSGATASTYTPASTAAGTTYFRVVVSASGNGCTPVTSNAATVTITPDISITAQPANITECVGGTQQLSVTATGGTPSLTYQWESSSAAAGPFTAVSGATASTYTPSAAAAGTMYYRVVVAATGNGCGSITSSAATVVVNPNVSITAQPTNVTECIGGTQQMSVTVTGGSGTVTYQWESATAAAGPYTTVSGATASTYTVPSTAAGTTYYRVVVNSTGGGCTSVTSNAGSATIIADPSITAQPTNITECIGGTQQLSVTAAGGTPSLTYQWESAAAAAGPFTAVSGATASTYTAPATAAGTTYYRVVVSASGNGCGNVTSNVATVVVVADPSITAQPANITECVGGTQQLSVTATGGTPSLTYQWESSSAAAGPFTAVSGATASTYTPSAAAAGTMYYRVVVSASGNGCTSVTSNAATVVVNPNVSITAQPTNITECIGGTQQLSVTATGGVGAITYQWESAAAVAGPYAAVSGATASTYTPASTAAGTTYFRVVVTSAGGGCTSVTSNAGTVVIVADPSITAQPANITECVGGTQQLSVTATGGTPSLTYQWESAAAAAGPFTAVSGATASTYTPSAAAAGTMYYRVVVSATGNGCTSVTSNAATVVVNPNVSITAQPNSITECIGGTQQLSVTATGGVGAITYQWESAAAVAGPYAAVSGATASTYTPASTAAGTTYYRVVVNSAGGGCTSVTSSAGTVVIVADPSITAQPTNITECIGGTQQLSVTATGGTPSLTYQWESSTTSGGTYSPISGATASTYTPASTAAGTMYYRVVVSASGNGCGSVTSNVSTVVVVADPSITAQPANITECVGGTQQLSVTATGGTPSLTYQWESASAAAGPFTAVSGATASTYTPPATAAGTTYYRVVVAASGNGCGNVTSNVATVVVNANVSITAQPANITECVGGTDQLSVTATGGVGAITYQWESATAAAGPYTAVSGATASTYTPPSTTAGTRYYRVVVNSAGGGCTAVTSGAATVTIAPDPTISVTATTADVCVGGGATLNATPSGGIGTCTTQWQSSPDGTTWTDIPGGTGNSYTTPALSTSTRYRAKLSCSGSGCCN